MRRQVGPAGCRKCAAHQTLCFAAQSWFAQTLVDADFAINNMVRRLH